jgi:hypothetical protein
MAITSLTFYVDLSLKTIGHSGTKEDPYSFKDYVNSSINSSDIVYLKGIVDISDRDFVVKGKYLFPWDLSKYGPWRIRANVIKVNQGEIISGGIFSTVNHINFGYILHDIRNMYLDIGNFFYVTSSTTFLGCLIKIGAGIAFTSSYLDFIDCVIVNGNYPTEYGGDILRMINCALNYKERSEVLKNCQIEWVPSIGLPNWDSPKNIFNTLKLFKGINTPPQPGFFPYIGYETDLFGNPRTGIGTGCMKIEINKKEGNLFDNYFNNNIVGLNIIRDNKYGCPEGDIIDNTSSSNTIKNFNNKPVKTNLNLGIFLSSCSKPSWLHK